MAKNFGEALAPSVFFTEHLVLRVNPFTITVSAQYMWQTENSYSSLVYVGMSACMHLPLPQAKACDIRTYKHQNVCMVNKNHNDISIPGT